MRIILCLALATLLIQGCGYSTQVTSGQSYLERYQDTPSVSLTEKNGASSAPHTVDIETAIRKAAAVEPTLRFPARIGLARIKYGALTPVPANEAEAWLASKKRLEPGFGEFLPISPLVANTVTASVNANVKERVSDVMNHIRLAAARQHMDAVLVYEVLSSSSTNKNALAFTDLTIIGGYFVPSRELQGKAIGNALLIDVIQGYPYGTVQTSVDLEELSQAWGAGEKQRLLAERAEAEVARKLAVEVEDMFKELRWKLAEARLQ